MDKKNRRFFLLSIKKGQLNALIKKTMKSQRKRRVFFRTGRPINFICAVIKQEIKLSQKWRRFFGEVGARKRSCFFVIFWLVHWYSLLFIFKHVPFYPLHLKKSIKLELKHGFGCHGLLLHLGWAPSIPSFRRNPPNSMHFTEMERNDLTELNV